MRKTKKLLSLLIIVIISLCTSNKVTYAKTLTYNSQIEELSKIKHSQVITSLDNVSTSKLFKPKNIYNGVQTLIYTGGKKDRWIHITPHITPNKLYLTMVDYNGNTVWGEVIIVGTDEVVHRFVGSNIKYVYLTGTPGGYVDVTDTEH